MTVWAGAVDYALRVTSDTPTFIALVPDLAERPFAPQSPFLGARRRDAARGAVHAGARLPLAASSASTAAQTRGARAPAGAGRDRRLRSSSSSSSSSTHGGRGSRGRHGSRCPYCSHCSVPRTSSGHPISACTAPLRGLLPAERRDRPDALLTLLALDSRGARRSPADVLLGSDDDGPPVHRGAAARLGTAQSCRLALRRTTVACDVPPSGSIGGFALGSLWPAYSLTARSRRPAFRARCSSPSAAAAPLIAARQARPRGSAVRTWRAASRATARLGRPSAFWLAMGGASSSAGARALGAALVTATAATESARLAIYWVEDRWRWPLMLAVGAVGISGSRAWPGAGASCRPCGLRAASPSGTSARIGPPAARSGIASCSAARSRWRWASPVVAETRRSPDDPLVAATVGLALGSRSLTLVGLPTDDHVLPHPPPGVWSLGERVPSGTGPRRDRPADRVLHPGATGHRRPDVAKAHVGSPHELALAERGYQLLRRYYAGGADWWQAAQAMWVRGSALGRGREADDARADRR